MRVLLIILATFVFSEQGGVFVPVSAAKKRFKKKVGFECNIIASRTTLTETRNVKKCDKACRNRLNCYGFQYSTEAKDCHLLDYVPTASISTTSGRVCGIAKRISFKPFVKPNQSSEVVTIPEPPLKEPLSSKTECPHLIGTLLNWDDPDTWENGVPKDGQVVTLPENSRVLIRTSIDGVFKKITIPSTSELIFADVESDTIQIKSKGFVVEGSLIAGSETCPIDNGKIEIELHGRRSDDIVQNPKRVHFKGISVTGTLSLHGRIYSRSWVRLGKTSRVGHDHILTQHKIDWVPGQQVVVVTSAVKDAREWHQNEVKTIDLVQPFKYSNKLRGSIIYFTSPLEYTHTANDNYQVEVGLLTRSIKIQGAFDDSEPTDPDPLTCEGKNRWGFDKSVQCSNTELTGYGGHVMIHGEGKGYVEGVELHRMGQTNVLGRYPMHFHLLENTCHDCYFRHSSVHRSYYRCVSIHGTHNMTVTENVGYDVTGYCYYLEDGIEEDNTISFNLAAHIHYIGEVPETQGQNVKEHAVQSNKLTLPADVTASGFYITNIRNNIIGNAASGGWAGFAFPVLKRPIGHYANVVTRPAARIALTIDGNTAHSTGWWWSHAGAFYFGGALYEDESDNNKLKYNAGRELSSRGSRNPCKVDMCLQNANWCDQDCSVEEHAWNIITNNKAFLTAGIGLQSWKGRMELSKFEAHDVGLAVEALASGFWIHNMLVVCRTGEKFEMPDGSHPNRISGNGFKWYDTSQAHIVSSATFRNCGRRSYDQYEPSPTRGCDDNSENGCSGDASVFTLLTHSDTFNPQIMQGTKDISFENCGRRIANSQEYPSVSGRTQNWIDADGTISGFDTPTLIGAGQTEAGLWWKVEDEVFVDEQGPVVFIQKQLGLNRDLGYMSIRWDETKHAEVGKTVCMNFSTSAEQNNCATLGYIKHFGSRFENDLGLPVTAASSITGLTGGFGWELTFLVGAPKKLTIARTEIKPDSPLILGIPYPEGTKVTIVAELLGNACKKVAEGYTCREEYHEVDSPEAVRNSQGNAYHMDPSGFLTVRVIMLSRKFIGSPDGFTIPTTETIYEEGYALDRFEREGILLLRKSANYDITIEADCGVRGNGKEAYCRKEPTTYRPSVCQNGFEQVSYDKCCDKNDMSSCVYA